ncbi:phosphotransferase [Defluviimonas sp. WL0002]|uniref:Phosphotransferase n=1 Tax=Albidovulum marisflavi TaxID=2984159 RepID=A0ABT2ZDV4_9RHOB|nr:phosphotransferase [Defluviimonas sp. WL0002]MCV2869275.1 phosphotransferase [Defluviimonas sp. WL0002]
MTDPVRQALALWGLEGATSEFVAGRENRVYRIRSDQCDFALRIKRPGYRTEAELLSELQWLDAMHAAGLSVPRPRPALSGALLETVGSHYVDLVGWLSGRPLGQSRDRLAIDDAPGIFACLGAEIARLHDACDAWRRPDTFTRCAWDLDGLLGDDPLWGRFWENPTLDPETRQLLQQFRQEAVRDLGAMGSCADYGLIHADIVRENVLVDGPNLRLIDFDDGGFGYRLFDIATALLKNIDEPNCGELQAALVSGYRSRRRIDEKMLDLFLALRAVTYVGWIVPRITEEHGADRNARFIRTARRLCSAYLGQPHRA